MNGYEPCQGHPVRDHGLIEGTRIEDAPTREERKPSDPAAEPTRRLFSSAAATPTRRASSPAAALLSSPQMAKTLTAALRESKHIASFFLACSKQFSSGAAYPVSPTEIIGARYDFGREPFGPAHGIQVPKGSDGLPKTVNWLHVPGVVSQSKNQSHCGGCYIVAALGSISSLNYLSNKSSIRLSVQQILDGNTVTNHGCEGGWPENVFDFIIRNGGVISETDYPYHAIRGPCKAIEAAGVTIANWAAVEPTEEAVKYAVAHQPVVSSIYTDDKFMKYKQDFLVVPDKHGKPDHSVLLLGYGECPLQGEYWIGMNSFDSHWGMTWRSYSKLFMMPRNTFHVGGALGVLSDVILPLGASMVPKVKAKTESCPLFKVGGHT